MFCKDCFYFNGCPMMRKILLPFCMIIIFFTGCSKQDNGSASQPVAHREPRKIRIAMVGDFLIHSPVYEAVHDPRTGSYNFKGIFKETEKYLSSPDFTVANLETRLAGAEKGYCGYPLFNSPEELARDMKDLGIDLVATANNHSMDMGKDGVINTLDALDRAGLYHVGTHRTAPEKDKTAIFDVGGVRVGFINYAQDTNGITVPSGHDYLVNLITRDSMKRDIERLKEKGSDLIIAYIHFGTEYQRQPNEFQRTLTGELFQFGADVVAGSHPHVVQPMEWSIITRAGKEKRVLAAYSLGNFISNQQWRYSDCGIILNLDIIKNPDGGAAVDSASYVPVWVHRYTNGLYRYRLLPVEKAMADHENKRDPMLTESHYRRLTEAWRDTTQLMEGFNPR